MRIVSARRLAPILALALALAACGPNVSNDDDDDDDDDVVDVDAGSPCSPNEVRCEDLSYQECYDGVFEERDLCTSACSVPLGGCVDCIPGEGDVCNGNAVFACETDGTFGELVDQCRPAEACEFGECTGGCTGEGSDLVYVVDQTFRLLSFDPLLAETPTDPFTLIGTLSCPSAGATPFSMSVDRTGTAWVLYSDGQIYNVSTLDASCEATTFQANQTTPDGASWTVFGMGFVSDAEGSNDETLFIASAGGSGGLGSIDTDTLAITSVGPMEGGSELSPELTGTGAGALYGYYPGAVTTFISEIDKTTALRGETWDMPGLGGGVNAWAFAHWGGRFYVFVTVDGNSQVLLVDPEQGGTTTTLLQSLPYTIVGAGVSTCAPIVIP
jgi:hypothetical protein